MEEEGRRYWWQFESAWEGGGGGGWRKLKCEMTLLEVEKEGKGERLWRIEGARVDGWAGLTAGGKEGEIGF